MDVGDIVVGQPNRVKDDLGEKCQKLFKNFLTEFSTKVDSIKSKYLDEALKLIRPERNTLFISFDDIRKFDQNLSTLIVEEFYRLYPFLCRALGSYVKDEAIKSRSECNANIFINALKDKDFFIGFYNFPSQLKIRDLRASHIGTLRRITGQIVRTHSVHPELISGCFECLDCGTEIPNVPQQFKFTQPTICRNNLCSNRTRFKLLLHKSRFVDFQKLRIQETQSELPRGCMPRSLDIVIRGADQVECVQAGDKCDFIGTLLVVPDVSQMFTAQAGLIKQENANRINSTGDGIRGLKSLGVREMSYRIVFLANCCIREGSSIPAQLEELNAINTDGSTGKDRTDCSEEDLARIYPMIKDKKLYDNLINSLFPSIYGNEEIKRGILLQLFGGVPKTTEEGTSLRGDINICIVGDPSTGKSQFLKLISDFAPSKAIYTSGKASTAAGLTAAVVRDGEGGFVIEAGALMLADQGICCIDEFDKMDIKDQIAIHEAMEQQTISVTKAGVKATLNARTSILAAANPIGGHYDRSKTLRNNLSLSLPIMSRFDLFFVVLDECNEIIDVAVASKIVEIHSEAFNPLKQKRTSVYSLQDIKSYIKFARSFKPKISHEAEREMVEIYKQLRINGGSHSGGYGGSRQSWRITVRQLESLIRLSEALAKMYCSDYVKLKHVQEAARLLSKSIVKIEQPDISLMDEDEIESIEQDVDEPKTESQSKVTKSMKLSYEDYKRMANSFVFHLRKEESKSDESGGVSRMQLIEWYLSTCEELESEAEFIKKKVLCDKVIDRLVSVDHILIALKSAEGEDENPILVVHPNYTPDEF